MRLTPAIMRVPHGAVVQWPSTSAFHAEDRGFESRPRYSLPPGRCHSVFYHVAIAIILFHPLQYVIDLVERDLFCYQLVN